MRFCDVLREIDEAIVSATWQMGEPLNSAMPEHHAQSYKGAGSGWGFTVVGYDHEPGCRTADGTAVKNGLVVHLTRGLAEKAEKLAVAQIGARL